MTKFSGREDQGYKDVLGELKRLIAAAKEEVETAKPEAEDNATKRSGSVSHIGSNHQGSLANYGQQTFSGKHSRFGKRPFLLRGIPSKLMVEGNNNTFGSSS
jgi:hypothetical protein